MDDVQTTDRDTPIALTAQIVAAYVGFNPTQVSALPEMIASVHKALTNLANPGAAAPEPVVEAPQVPAVSIKKSVTPDYIICLEDGMQFKSLKRHLKTKFDMTPEDYRKKWGLPSDYPMVAANYAAHRSRLAKQIGLGKKRPSAR